MENALKREAKAETAPHHPGAHNIQSLSPLPTPPLAISEARQYLPALTNLKAAHISDRDHSPNSLPPWRLSPQHLLWQPLSGHQRPARITIPQLRSPPYLVAETVQLQSHLTIPVVVQESRPSNILHGMNLLTRRTPVVVVCIS